MTERQQKRNTAGQGQRRKTARPEQLTRKAPETARSAGAQKSEKNSE